MYLENQQESIEDWGNIELIKFKRKVVIMVFKKVSLHYLIKDSFTGG